MWTIERTMCVGMRRTHLLPGQALKPVTEHYSGIDVSTEEHQSYISVISVCMTVVSVINSVNGPLYACVFARVTETVCQPPWTLMMCLFTGLDACFDHSPSSNSTPL